MKAVILAGGYGTRICEETDLVPKPMIEIGNKPLIWHIMKIYSFYGINDFIICCGYKGHKIKEFFANYSMYMSDLDINLSENTIQIINNNIEPWRVKLIDTGQDSMTGGRLKRIKKYINNETFLFTYGDGLADVNIIDLIDNHKKSKRMATVTAIQPPGRYGLLEIKSNNQVKKIIEKPPGDSGWVNGGFFVLEPSVFDFINSDNSVWEKEPLEKIASMNELNAYIHNGFWQSMDTLRDKRTLEKMWDSERPPWKLW